EVRVRYEAAVLSFAGRRDVPIMRKIPPSRCTAAAWLLFPQWLLILGGRDVVWATSGGIPQAVLPSEDVSFAKTGDAIARRDLQDRLGPELLPSNREDIGEVLGGEGKAGDPRRRTDDHLREEHVATTGGMNYGPGDQQRRLVDSDGETADTSPLDVDPRRPRAEQERDGGADDPTSVRSSSSRTGQGEPEQGSLSGGSLLSGNARIDGRKLHTHTVFDGKPRPKNPTALLPMTREEGLEYIGIRRLTRFHVFEQVLLVMLAMSLCGIMILVYWYMTDRVNLTHPPNEVRVDPITGEDLPRPFHYLRSEEFQEKTEERMNFFCENTTYVATVLGFHMFQTLLFLVAVYDVNGNLPEAVFVLEAVIGLLLFADPATATLQRFILSDFGTLQKLPYAELAIASVVCLSPILSVFLSRQDEYDKNAGSALASDTVGLGVHWFSFRFLACLRMRKYYLFMFPELSGMRSPVARGSYALLLRCFETFTFFYVTVCFLWTVEFADGLFPRSVPDYGNWSLDESLWFMVTTALTIGYGDYSPSTVFSRVVVMLQLISVLLMVGMVFEIMSRIWAESASGLGTYNPRER
ncbi:unnamed protein product, partial [Amoebophrya sp. A25]